MLLLYEPCSDPHMCVVLCWVLGLSRWHCCSVMWTIGGYLSTQLWGWLSPVSLLLYHVC